MALDAFLELWKQGKRPIEGESADAQFPGAIELENFEFGPEGAKELKEQQRAEAQEAFEQRKQKLEAQMSGQTYMRPRNSGGGGNNALDKFNFTVKKNMDKSSPALFLAFCLSSSLKHEQTHRPFDHARVSIRKAGGNMPRTYLVFEFRDVHVVQYKVTIPKDAIPEEDITFGFSACALKYSPQKPGGELDAEIPSGWDFKSQERWDGIGRT